MTRCDFCRNQLAQWRYPADSCDWHACANCHEAIEADDRETLLDRVIGAPVPRTLPDRFAPHFRERARELHERFWATSRGPAEPV
jgi:hypothetical protein